MRRFTNDERSERGSELMSGRRSGEKTTPQPTFEGLGGDQVMSRRRMLRLTGGAIAGAAVALTTGLNIGTRDARALWNTGCRRINNSTGGPLYVLDLENQGYQMYIPNSDTKSFGGVIFPWCNSADEVRRKAFVFKSGYDRFGSDVFYVFQNFTNDSIYYLRERDKYNFERKIWAGASPSSYVDLIIRQRINNGRWDYFVTAYKVS